MEKYVVIALLSVFCLWLMNGVSFQAMAQEVESDVAEAVIEEEVSYQDLETEAPKLLPNNPFYFIKTWSWGIRRALTFNSVKRAELELKILNEQAAELKRLKEVAPDNIGAIEKAVANYQDNVERLRNRLEALQETSENPNIDKLLDKLTDRSLKHQQIFDDLKIKLEQNPALVDKLDNIQDRVNEIVARIPEKFEDALKFEERIKNIIQQRPQRIFKELREAELLDRLAEKLPEQAKERLESLKEETISKFEAQIQSWSGTDKEKLLTPGVIKQLPGDSLRRIEILKQVEGLIVNPGLKAEIKEIKEGLEQSINIEVSRERVQKLIEEARRLIIETENALFAESDEEIASAAKELLKIAKTHLSKAEAALSENKIGEAFGQANSAVLTARNALRHIKQRSATDVSNIPCTLIAPSCPAGETAIKSSEKDAKGCPVLKCVPIKSICIQVITPAISPDGVCKNFPTPCDVPSTWKKINRCPASTDSNATSSIIENIND